MEGEKALEGERGEETVREAGEKGEEVEGGVSRRSTCTWSSGGPRAEVEEEADEDEDDEENIDGLCPIGSFRNVSSA